MWFSRFRPYQSQCSKQVDQESVLYTLPYIASKYKQIIVFVFQMSSKREREQISNASISDNSDEDLMDDNDEKITFEAMTKEERLKHNESLGIYEDEEGDEDEDDEDDDEDMVNVDFEFSDPKECHFKSIRNFLRYLLMGSAKIDFSPLADAIISQVEVGSIVEVNGEEDAYAFLTALNIQHYKVFLI